ncbi:hypothetical protein CROQUDRAFT_90766 [Cronartium quercuum f. sp. fusiforme G11]|uniref:Uncharacterized protein n=1 Tax=Cronartium quercuum f. sp. fusiforme G11 TaxID=708437 RepID=A0A9P6NPU6_9BASI|nr:hypothetical protein CROQUDRAFT_90766 [Cronartium quercuum f. sp. fusiforme G11]
MVPTRKKDYGENQSDESEREREENDEDKEKITTPPQSHFPFRPTTPTPALSAVFSTLSISSPTQSPTPPITEVEPPNNMSAGLIPEWKTIVFRSRIMTIVLPGWLDKHDAHIIDPEHDRIFLMVVNTANKDI